MLNLNSTRLKKEGGLAISLSSKMQKTWTWATAEEVQVLDQEVVQEGVLEDRERTIDSHCSNNAIGLIITLCLRRFDFYIFLNTIRIHEQYYNVLANLNFEI